MRGIAVAALAAVGVAALVIGGDVVLGQDETAVGVDAEPQPAPGWRPGDLVTFGQPECPTEVRPTRHVAPSVMFAGDRPEVIRFPDGWTKETRRIGGQLVTVTSADDALRAKIFSTAGVVTSVDGYGCDPASPSARDELLRPAASGGLASVGKVKSVSVCRSAGGAPIYREDGTPYPPKALGMEAGSQLTGAVAERFVRDLMAAPLGTGPTVTNWRVCGADPGREIVVLRVGGSEHDQDVLYRYDGCKHNGTDGKTLRRATMATAKVIFVGVHAPRGHTNVMTQLLIGPPGPVV